MRNQTALDRHRPPSAASQGSGRWWRVGESNPCPCPRDNRPLPAARCRGQSRRQGSSLRQCRGGDAVTAEPWTEVERLKAALEFARAERHRVEGALLDYQHKAKRLTAELDAACDKVERLKSAEAKAQAMGRQAQDDLDAALAQLAERRTLDQSVDHLARVQLENVTKERDAARTDVERLRRALIAAGTAAGAGLSEAVSTDFLMGVPQEVTMVVGQLRAEGRAAERVFPAGCSHSGPPPGHCQGEGRQGAGDLRLGLAERDAAGLAE